MNVGCAAMVAREAVGEAFHEQQEQREALLAGIELLPVQRPPLEGLGVALVAQERQAALDDLDVITTLVDELGRA